jgi:hypothetical protein
VVPLFHMSLETRTQISIGEQFDYLVGKWAQLRTLQEIVGLALWSSATFLCLTSVIQLIEGLNLRTLRRF